MSDLHWLTRFDPDDGQPYGTGCECEIGSDHFEDGSLSDPERVALDAAFAAVISHLDHGDKPS